MNRIENVRHCVKKWWEENVDHNFVDQNKFNRLIGRIEARKSLQQLKFKKVLQALALGAVFFLLFLQTSCSIGVDTSGLVSAIRDTNMELRNTVDSFDRAIDALSRQSSDWQVTLEELKEGLVDDVQSTLRVEITELLQTGVLASGGEFRCDAEFLRLRTEQKLRRIRNNLAEAINEAIETGGGSPIPLLPEIPIEPFICDASPSAVDLSLELERRNSLDIYGFDLKSLPIMAEVVDPSGRENIPLRIISELHMVLDLTTSIDENSQYIALSWDGESQSVIPILSTIPGPICDIQTQLITPGKQSFIPVHIRGDREYKGHGPCIRFDLNIREDAEGKVLAAYYEMEAFECDDNMSKPHPDYTTAKESKRVELLNLQNNPGERIISYNLSSRMSFDYIDDDIQDDIFQFGGNNPVEKLIFVGDTDGPEAGTKTGVTIHFRPIEIKIEKCNP